MYLLSVNTDSLSRFVNTFTDISVSEIARRNVKARARFRVMSSALQHRNARAFDMLYVDCVHLVTPSTRSVPPGTDRRSNLFHAFYNFLYNMKLQKLFSSGKRGNASKVRRKKLQIFLF